jgi:hypothetical protein
MIAKLEKVAGLKAAWDAYGHVVAWADIKDAKLRGDGCYVVLLMPDNSLADLASPGNGTWEMQNDCTDPVTDAEWSRLRIVPQCDWYEIPEGRA